MFNFEELGKAVMQGHDQLVKELTEKAIAEKVEASVIINQGLIPAMNIVGKLFKDGDMFVPEVLMSAKAMHAGMDVVKPLLVDGQFESKGTIVLGTVKGDLHDIGKNLVGMMFESAGFKVIDLGVDTSPEDFAAAAKEHKAQIVGLSALLTTTMLAMKDTIEVLKQQGVRDQVKVLIGGAPISQEFADQIGADGYAPDAASATELALKLLS